MKDALLDLNVRKKNVLKKSNNPGLVQKPRLAKKNTLAGGKKTRVAGKAEES